MQFKSLYLQKTCGRRHDYMKPKLKKKNNADFTACIKKCTMRRFNSVCPSADELSYTPVRHPPSQPWATSRMPLKTKCGIL